MTQPTVEQMSQWLESREFYDLMQCYRHMPLSQQEHVVTCYEAVKAHVAQQILDTFWPVVEAASRLDHSAGCNIYVAVGRLCDCGIEDLLSSIATLTQQLGGISQCACRDGIRGKDCQSYHPGKT